MFLPYGRFNLHQWFVARYRLSFSPTLKGILFLSLLGSLRCLKVATYWPFTVEAYPYVNRTCSMCYAGVKCKRNTLIFFTCRLKTTSRRKLIMRTSIENSFVAWIIKITCYFKLWWYQYVTQYEVYDHLRNPMRYFNTEIYTYIKKHTFLQIAPRN